MPVTVQELLDLRISVRWEKDVGTIIWAETVCLDDTPAAQVCEVPAPVELERK
jgi:hypothetical protein